MDILKLQEHEISTRSGGRVVVSFTPCVPIYFGRDDLAQLAAVDGPSPRDLEIGALLRGRQRPADAFVFQSQAATGPGCWHFEEDVTDEEAAQLGYWIVRAHRFLYRELVDAGINLAVGAAKGYRELAALRAGSDRVIGELAREATVLTGQARVECEADLFLLRHLMVFTSLHLPSLIDGLIPDKLPLCERRAASFRAVREQAKRREAA